MAAELGVCGECNAEAKDGKCIPCTRKRSTNKYVCTYCNVLGHNKRTCEALVFDLERMRELDAQFQASKASLLPTLPSDWENQKARETALIETLKYIAGLPKTATTWKSAAKAALRNV